MLPAGHTLFSVVRLATCYSATQKKGKMGPFFFIVIGTVFWSMFEQSGGQMTLFADRAMDLTLFGMELTAAQFSSANAIFIILHRPLCADVASTAVQ